MVDFDGNRVSHKDYLAVHRKTDDPLTRVRRWLAEPIERYGAGRVVPAGDLEALTEAARELLGDPQALAEARAGAERARAELTWEAAAAAHLRLYEELA